MKGAGERVIPQYVEQPSNPFATQEEKSSKVERFTDNQRMMEKTKQSLGYKPETPLIDLQVYQPPAPAKPPAPVNVKNFIPIGTSNYGMQVAPNLMYPYMDTCGTIPYNNLPYTHVANQPPILKNYTINIGGADADHSKINAIFEDILPEKFNNNSFNTILERVNILHYIRSIFIKQYDGEDVSLSGSSDNSLLRYIRFLDLNPYNPSVISSNPYKGLPDNMLIYRSCYPIRKNPILNQVQCASRALGMNVRIYRLTNSEYDANKSENKKTYKDFDVWRELKYYEFIKEYIIKKNTCPNFAIMYSYNISQKCDIDFEQVNNLKRNLNTNSRESRFIVRNNDGILDGNSTQKPAGVSPGHMPMTGGSKNKRVYSLVGGNLPMTIPYGYQPKNYAATYGVPNKNGNVPILEKNGSASSGKALIMLTEAPTTNIIAWASKEYKVNGNVRQMINTGYHSKEVWLSIIFQIMAALCAMQVKGIAINKFSLVDNVYIKEITTHGHIRKYWIYNIYGIDYYIPNYGYLVMIDSNYKDIVEKIPKRKEKVVINNNPCAPVTAKVMDADEDTEDNNQEKKIYCTEWGDDAIMVNDLIMNTFKNIVNPNNFSNAFKNSGGSPPDEAVLELLKKISNGNEIGSISKIMQGVKLDVEKYIRTYMTMFVNNRVGTLLYTDEINHIIKGAQIDYEQPGQILVHEFAHNTYKFVLLLGPNPDYYKSKNSLLGDFENNRAGVSILTTKHGDEKGEKYIQSSVSYDILYKYSQYEPITQSILDNNFTPDNLLETYRIVGPNNKDIYIKEKDEDNDDYENEPEITLSKMDDE